jgi:hypothetical protein
LASTLALSRDVGFPTTWPASWIFALRYRTSPAGFDLAAGTYLFYRQNNLDGLADSGDERLILDGFSSAKQDGQVTYREIETSARFIVSLDLPEELSLTLEARSTTRRPTRMEVEINGTPAGFFEVGTTWSPSLLQTPRLLWERGPNVITLRPGSGTQIDRVAFERIKK